MKVKELLADPKAWTKKASARDAIGRAVDVDSPTACAFCLTGAIRRCYDNTKERSDAYVKIRGVLREKAGWDYGVVVMFNDDQATTHADVMKVLEQADV